MTEATPSDASPAGAGKPGNPGSDGVQDAQSLVLVTGPSGAGRSTAINALEDVGYEAIDNLPLSLMPRLLDGPPIDHPLALGLDARNRDFSADALVGLIDRLDRMEGVNAEVMYLDCRDDVLLRRFSETRRRHPLAPAEDPAIGIRREKDLLLPVRSKAGVLIDTSEMTPHELKAEVEGWFAPETGQKLAVTVHSFSYKRGIPRGVDMVFDCRFLRNPYWDATLRELDGTDNDVAEHIMQDARFADFFDKVLELSQMLLPAWAEEGKAHLSIGFGCTGGKHRSVAVAQKLAAALATHGWVVPVRHRELELQLRGSGEPGSDADGLGKKR